MCVCVSHVIAKHLLELGGKFESRDYEILFVAYCISYDYETKFLMRVFFSTQTLIS
jgi:hypothetical protein